MAELPHLIENAGELDELLSRPSEALAGQMAALDDDIIILGAGGKMGPTVARMARRALDEAGNRRKVFAVSRFSVPGVREKLEAAGVETLPCNLFDREELDSLPRPQNVIYMAGRKFGSAGNPGLTWLTNCWLPGQVAFRFRESRIVAFSTGNVYPLVPVISSGATEADDPDPLGEYAQSCLGRERIFECISDVYGTPVLLFRLNYAVELRYGVLLDIARKVAAGEPIGVSMGCVNVIWQGDASERALRCLFLCASPAERLNVTGPETLPVREIASHFGAFLGREPDFVGEEAETALLSNAAKSIGLFGAPHVPVDDIIRWTAHWVESGGEVLGKPTHFEQRDGRF